ncbi:ribonuclease III [Klebsormidium nitens]|uniref:Ribonuclease III n=1 Tax=Klebsormidium nitens TaxID=105231 RepID=A0A1Y1IQH1_KLENI|nr:ribonuclease III [Klebsormidium nitens]|eukprot:GAQ91709.1 ribonuclease III [Klebsormidium nitens]
MIYSAGCLPFTVKNNQIYFLLGKDRTDGRESDFGGRSEDVDKGDPKRTAIREFYEETIGMILDMEEVEARLKDPGKMELLDPVTLFAMACLIFIAWMKYKDRLFRAEHDLYDTDDEADTYSEAAKDDDGDEDKISELERVLRRMTR